MRISEAIDIRRKYQLQLCEVLELDPEKTSDITINRENYRVEVTGAELDLATHRGWYHLELGAYPTLGLTPGNQITYDQWDAVLKVDDEWTKQFPARG